MNPQQPFNPIVTGDASSILFNLLIRRSTGWNHRIDAQTHDCTARQGGCQRVSVILSDLLRLFFRATKRRTFKRKNRITLTLSRNGSVEYSSVELSKQSKANVILHGLLIVKAEFLQHFIMSI